MKGFSIFGALATKIWTVGNTAILIKSYGSCGHAHISYL